MKALVIGGPCDGRVTEIPDETCDGEIIQIEHTPGTWSVNDRTRYRVTHATLYQGDRTIIGYVTVLLPPDEPAPGNAVNRCYESGIVRAAL